MYILRKIDEALLEWKNDDSHKPLLLRGARQVGKTTAVRQLAKSFEHYIEVNFESDRSIHSIFNEDIEIDVILQQIEFKYRKPVKAGKTLIFFDEIQECPRAITALRFFYEKVQNIHVIAAGSLLEFVFDEISDFGVGRIRNLYVYPLSFAEFVNALGNNRAFQFVENASFDNPLPDLVHKSLLEDLKKYMVIGGMPAVVHKYIQTQNLLEVQKEQDDILVTLKEDFSKYKRRVSPEIIRETLHSIAMQTGGKFTYTNSLLGLSYKQSKECVNLLERSKLVVNIECCYANGVPLGGDIKPKMSKLLMLDVGLYLRECALDVSEWILDAPEKFISRGALAEMFVGLELKKNGTPFTNNELFYWRRDIQGSSAEVDYMVQHRNTLLPIEVKSGVRGSMKSLRLLMEEKKIAQALRVSEENFSTLGDIKILPIYLVGQWQKFM